MDVEYAYYQQEIAPVLPPAVLDFHTHTWSLADRNESPWDTDRQGGRYMVCEAHYPPEQLLRDGQTCFPERNYQAVCLIATG